MISQLCFANSLSSWPLGQSKKWFACPLVLDPTSAKREIEQGANETSSVSKSDVEQVWVKTRKAFEMYGFSSLQFQGPLPSRLLSSHLRMKTPLPLRPQELIQLVHVLCIDCRDDILLASDLFCVGVTKHSKIQFAVANPSSWRRHHGKGGVSQA